MKMISVVALSCSLFLMGCATTTGQERALVLSKCPVLKNYTQEEMTRAAKELRGLPSDAQLSEMITDYSKLRDACRLADRKLKSVRKANNTKKRY